MMGAKAVGRFPLAHGGEGRQLRSAGWATRVRDEEGREESRGIGRVFGRERRAVGRSGWNEES